MFFDKKPEVSEAERFAAGIKQFLSIDIAEILSLTPAYTLDVAELERRMFTFVFVADECMYGHRKHDLVSTGASGYKPFFTCYTDQNMAMLVKEMDGQNYPIVFDGLDDPSLPPWAQRKARVYGELYALRGCSVIELDNYKQNGVRFTRKWVKVTIPYFKRHRKSTQTYNGTWNYEYSRSKDYLLTIDAQMYVGRQDYWLDQLSDRFDLFSFSTVPVQQVDRIWIKEFFHFPRQF